MKQDLKKLLLKLDANSNNPYRSTIEAAVERSILNKKPIQLLLFTCSTIQANKLFSKKPWEYVCLDPSGNNLESDLPKLRAMLTILNQAHSVEVTIIIGNTDPYYIYLQQFNRFPAEDRDPIWRRFKERWDAYRRALASWVKQELPDTDVTVQSWFELEKELEERWTTSFENEFNEIYQNLNSYFSQDDLDWEFRQLTQQFGPGKYFASLTQPEDSLLRDWVRRKFAEYALQGAWLARQFPDATLIQNEKPSDLRSKMYQPVLQERERRDLPIIYPFGVDNQGYA